MHCVLGKRLLIALLAIFFLGACGVDLESHDHQGVTDVDESGTPGNDKTTGSNGNDHASRDEQAHSNPAANNDYSTGAPTEPGMAHPPEYDYATDEYYPEPEPVEQFSEYTENDFVDTDTENTSTFSLDVSTGSYTLMRRDLQAGRLPTPESVRVEEYINFFRFNYPEPSDDMPFTVNMELAPSFFGSTVEQERQLLRIGLKAKHVSREDMKHNNLVFLVDVSGSMSPQNRLPLAKQSLHILLEQLHPTDTVAIQTYASGTETVLEPTLVSEYETIATAIDGLVASGGTYGEGGIVAAYDLAEQAKVDGGNNRVIILTDGDFNIGKRGEDIVEIIRDYRERHITLSAVGYGMGNYNDSMMVKIASEGNGNYFYIDTIEEAQRVFGDEVVSTLEVVAADVKVQIEFDTEAVARYRLIGYEKRLLENQDFEDDSKDAGEVGPNHTVTALYELELHEDYEESASGMIATVRLRHKEEFGEDSVEQTQSIKNSQLKTDFDSASTDFRFVAAVAEFAEILRKSQHSEGARFDEVVAIATENSDDDDFYRQEFIELVEIAKSLWQ